MTLYLMRGFPQPEDHAKIWRYMKLEDFVNTLKSGVIWFGRASDYEAMEGRPTMKMEVMLRSIDIEYAIKLQHPINDPEHRRKELEYLKKVTFLSCWHENTVESSKMWEQKTGAHGRDVVIQTTYSRLKETLKAANKYNFWSARVLYKDHEKDLYMNDHLLSDFFRKEHEFKHENEVRAATTFYELRDRTWTEPGLNIVANLDILIESIIVTPKLIDSVKRIMENAGLVKPVIASEISA